MRFLLLCLVFLCACGQESAAPKPASTPDVIAGTVPDVIADSAQDVAPVDAAVEVTADTATSDEASKPACLSVKCKPGEFCDPKTAACQPRTDEYKAAVQRNDCVYGPGATVAQTVGSEWPTGKDIPIDHIVLTMMENRSFDHYFGAAKKLGWDVDGFPEDAGNPDSKGNFVPIFHTVTPCINDVAHGWSAVHTQVNGGLMDGFITTNEPNGERALGYFDETDLVFYYAAAKAFGISDRHFCSVPGPTWINRLYYVSATSFGRTSNKAPPPETMAKVYNQQLLYQLDEAGVD